MTPKTTMLRAAELLNEDAMAGIQSCAVREKLWACPDCVKGEDGKCVERRASEERNDVADRLLLLAKDAA